MSEVPYTICLDDDPMPQMVIEEALGLKCFGFSKSSDIKRLARKFNPLGAFIDVHLKGECGLDVIPLIRSYWPSTAIIIITGDPEDKLVGQALASGADDFIRKPISPLEVMARLNARIEDRKEKDRQSLSRFGDIRLDVRQKNMVGPKGHVVLSNKVLAIMTKLMNANGVVVPKDALMREIWGAEVVSINALDRRIFEVRKALRAISDKVELHSIYGVGMVLKMGSLESDLVHLKNLEHEMKSL